MTTRIRQQPRRYGLALLAMAILLVAVLFAVRPSGRALATSGGDPYSVPVVVDTNPNPNIVETTITADEATVDIGNGVTAHAQTFNGQIPGPEFQLKVGDTVIVHFHNSLSRETGIHWHGIELENNMDGTPFTQNQVAPGENFLYKFKVSRPGIYWYHPHHHSSTNQVFKGLYGSIVVTDPNEASLEADGTLPSPANTRTIVLSDTTVCKALGTNDAETYDPALPWVGGGPLPVQAFPHPVDLCETAPIDEDGASRGAFAAGDIPNIQKASTAGRTNEGQTVLTNGKNVGGRSGSPGSPGALAAGAETLDVHPGQGLRLQIINAAAIRHMRLRLTDNAGTQIPLVRVGGEGGLLDHAVLEGTVHPLAPGAFDTKYDLGEILLSPGSRADVVIAVPAAATGVLTLWTEDYRRTGSGFPDIPTVPVMHLNVTGPAASTYTIAAGTPLRSATGDPVAVLAPATGVLLNPATFAPPKLGLASQDIQLTGTGTALGINGTFGTHDVSGDYTLAAHLASTRYAKLGDTLELTVTNVPPGGAGAHHPYHLHGFSMQPISLTDTLPPIDKPPYIWPYPEFRDNIDIPAGYTLTFRIKLEDRPLADGVTMGGGYGRWVFHCHIFFHATNGMLGELVVTAPNGNEQPNVNANVTQVNTHHGDLVTVHGTYHDPDGDPVTLSASIGSVSDDGGGLWTWTYTTVGADDSQFVYVTATDSAGLKNQAPFILHLINTPPTLVLPGAQSEDFHDPLSFGISATDPNTADTVSLSATGLPAGLSFTDNGNRTGTVSGTITGAPGPYVVTFSADDHVDPTPTTGTVTITVTREETTTVYTGVTGPVLDGSTVTLSGLLREDGITPISGRLLTMKLGSGGGTQTCLGTTVATGSASCTIVVNQPVGPQPVSATFAGDVLYLPSGGASTVVVFTAMSLKQDTLAQTNALLPGATKKDADKLKDVVKKLGDSLDPSLWIDANHVVAKHGNKVFDRERDAVHKLMDLIKDKKSAIPDTTLQGMIDKLVHADRILAEEALADAIAAPGDPHKIAQAQNELTKAADALANADFDGAIEHYKKSWKKSQESLGH